MRLPVLRTTILSLLALVSLSLFPLTTAAAEKPGVAILPLALHAPENLSYLKDGIRSMLGSRLSAGAGVKMIGQAEVGNALAKTGKDASPEVVGRELNADLVLSGSITSLGQGISIDMKATRPGDPLVVESFFVSAEDQSSLIKAVDKMAGDISARMYGKASASTGGSSRVAPAAITPVVEATPDQSAHPDRLFGAKKVILGAGAIVPPVADPFPVAVPQSHTSGSGYQGMVERSQYLAMEVQDFANGDVFGDGTTQLVVAESDKIHVYRRDGSRLAEAGEVPAPAGYVKIIAVHLADLDQDGRAEIYISANAENDAVASAVEWDGVSFVKIFEKQPWYIKTMRVKGEVVLLGQKGDFETPYAPGVFRLQVQGGALVAGEKLSLPEGVNLFDFVLADFTGDGQLEVAVIDQDDDLTLYNDQGDMLGRGDGNFGYTVRYVGKASGTASSERKNYNVPAGLIARDLNGDGRSELIVMKNPSSLTTLVKTIASYTGGSIEVLSWNGISFVDLWSTGKIGSYIAGYRLADQDGSGAQKLEVAVIGKKSGKLVKTSQSLIATYPLPVQARQ